MAAEVNVYSSRHYDTDDALYAKFTEQTGIEVNRIEGKADELMARIEAEGANSPADVFIAVDAGRMFRAADAGMLQAVDSDLLTTKIPAHIRHPDNLWFGVSQRARVIFYSKDRVENPPQTYEELTDEKWKDSICIRTSSNIYNLSLLASIIHADGEDAAKEWAAGVNANLARAPQGGDTDQLRGIISGECDLAVSNHYYYLRGFDQDIEGLTAEIDQLGWVWPNQSDRGVHMNLTGVGMLANAPNTDEAKALMEFFTSEFAQRHFAEQNNEYPAVPGIPLDEDTARMGYFIIDNDTPTEAYGSNAAKAQAIYNEVNFP
ncbi:extracellular solute-binding protein [Roseovarius sp. LXJ103]|nr:extracellular solute-binding protein [Roseovarius carneus]PWE37353.1 Fe(3+) ABC transporter substrate-binding protein [Pelagicola sp. LXJ1103]